MIFTIFAFIVALGILITFHELGHYYVAKRCGVKVLRFSIGFGKIIYSRYDKHGTEWAVSAIPLGGYVKMQEQVAENATTAQKNAAFPNKKLWQKTAIVAAGPIANFLLAILLYLGINLIGTQEPAAVIISPTQTSAAANAGLSGKQRILSVNGVKIDSYNQLRWELIKHASSGGVVNVIAESETGTSNEYQLSLNSFNLDDNSIDFMTEIGLNLAVSQPVISGFITDSVAEKSGLKIGDSLVSINNNNIDDAKDLIKIISANPNQEITITALRNNAQIDFKLIPNAQIDDNGLQVGRIGAMLGSNVEMTLVRYGIFEGSYLAVKRTISTAWFSLKMLGRMVTGDVSLKNISGPVTIADYAGKTARTGLISYIGFMALISISIGILNLLPIPMLDGGHLMYYAVEAIRGRPVSEKTLEQGHRIGFALLMVLMGLAFFNDLTRLFT